VDTEHAFAEIANRHRGIIYKVARSYARNEEELQDLVQEILLQIWLSLKTYRSVYALSTWLYRIALNVSISFLRKEESRRKRLDRVGNKWILEQPLPERSERQELLHQWIQQLDPLNRALILLYLDDYSHAEIADILGISKSNVGTKLSRLRSRLKIFFTKKIRP